MAKTDTFHCSVITPERSVLECEATFVAFPAHDGEMGILKNRAPLVCKLGIGVLRVETGTERHVFFIDGGFAQMVDNRLTILTQQAKAVKEIDTGATQKQLRDAQAMPMQDDVSFDARQKALRRAQTQLQLARSSQN